jgi:hypothetical protein
MARILNRAGHSCTTTGTGTITLGAALGAVNTNVCSYQTFATAGVADGDVVSYLILDSNGAWEYGTGTYTAAGTTLSRTLGQSSTGALLSLTASSQVFIPARREDIAKLTEANTFTAANTLAAGTTALAPLTFQSGTNLTTATAGVMEYDGVIPMFTHAASERGVLSTEQWICNTATVTLLNQTAAQPIFQSPTNGRVTVAGSTTYQFECAFDLTAMSATSGSFGFAIGGTATLNSIKWRSMASKSTVVGTVFKMETVNGVGYLISTSAAVTQINPANNTTTTGNAEIRGLIRVNAGGTIIPQVSLTTAATAIVGVNSYFRLWPVGSNTAVSLGNWS